MLSNAAITMLNSPGVPDRNGDVTGSGPTVWLGRCPAYLRRVRSRVIVNSQTAGDGGQRVLQGALYRDQLIVRTPPGQLLQAVPGDDSQGWTVVVEDRRTGSPVSRRFRVVAVDHRAVGSRVDSLRLELDDEQTP